jgi:hypothetical protein
MKNRRTKFVVDSSVQWTLVRRVACHWLFFLALTAALLPLWVVIMGGDIVGATYRWREIVAESWLRTLPVILFFLAIAPMIVYDVLKLSHRFAGPVCQLHKAIKGLAAGEEIRPLQLREGDFWKEVAADFNALAEQVAALRKQETPAANREPAACGASDAEDRWEKAWT